MPLHWFVNKHPGTPGTVVLPAGGFRRAKAEITRWPGYAKTPLHDLPALAAQTGIGTVLLKDEGDRFGLGSVKALGGAYAVADVLLVELARRGTAASTADLLARRHDTSFVTIACATDGNHGRSVAWGARQFGASCVVFLHAAVSAGRAEAIARYGAEIRRVEGTYDDSVRAVAIAAEREGWIVVSDTSWPGYTELPRLIMQGYRLMTDEALEQWTGPPPTHAFVQAGVGGIAASVAAQLRAGLDRPVKLLVVEPDRAACLLASAKAGRQVTVGGDLDTIMAGLACGEPSLLAWQELERAATAFITIEDSAAQDAMRTLARLGIVSGESGAAGLAGLLEAAQDGGAREALGLDPSSRVLLFSTEGATDPALYARLVA